MNVVPRSPSGGGESPDMCHDEDDFPSVVSPTKLAFPLLMRWDVSEIAFIPRGLVTERARLFQESIISHILQFLVRNLSQFKCFVLTTERIMF